jgi:hypothetical protein
LDRIIIIIAYCCYNFIVGWLIVELIKKCWVCDQRVKDRVGMCLSVRTDDERLFSLKTSNKHRILWYKILMLFLELNNCWMVGSLRLSVNGWWHGTRRGRVEGKHNQIVSKFNNVVCANDYWMRQMCVCAFKKQPRSWIFINKSSAHWSAVRCPNCSLADKVAIQFCDEWTQQNDIRFRKAHGTDHRIFQY